MTFSLSKFDPKSPRHCAVLLLAMWTMLCIGSELAGRYVFPRVSRVYRRIESERIAVQNLSATADHPAILLIGNSLFEKGVDIPVMQQELPEYEVRRYVISATSSLDWYYGLRRMMAEGSRPQVVVAGFSVRQLLSQNLEGDLSIHLLVRTADIGSLGHDLSANNTELSELYLSNLSGFYGSRSEVRKWLMGKMLPDVESLGAAIAPPIAPYTVDDAMVATAERRLQKLNAVCAENGTKLVLVIPPARNGRDSASAIAAIQEAGRRVGVMVLSPVRPGEWGAESFSDGIHLNHSAALNFTSRLSSDLKQAMAEAPIKAHTESRERIAEAPLTRSVVEVGEGRTHE